MKKYCLAIAPEMGTYKWMLKAIDLGYSIISIAEKETSIGRLKSIITKEYVIDLSERKKIFSVVAYFKIDYVIPFGAEEYKISLIALINHYFKLHGPSYAAISLCSNKALFYKYLRKNEFPTPKFQLELPNRLQDKNIELLTFPCIVKPSGSAGQRGLRKIFNKKELEDFFNNPLIEEEYPAERIGDVYVAEEYVKGRWINISGIVSNGKMKLLYRWTMRNGWGDMKHRLPLECIGDFEPISDEIHQEIQRLITSIGLDNSPFVVDLIADEQCSYTKAFLEINPRPGGITPSIYDMTHGTDLIGLLTRMYRGEQIEEVEIDALLQNQKYMYIKYIILDPGKIKSISWPKQHENIIIFRSQLQAGSIITASTDVKSGARNGYIALYGDSSEEVVKISEEFINGISVEYEVS